MKLSAILEDDENAVIVPLVWLTREERQTTIQDGYEVIPIPGYHETNEFRAFKVIGQFSKDIWWFRSLSIPIWEDWKLTAEYASIIEERDSTAGIQMFNHLDDDEKIKALKYKWFGNTRTHIKKYFQEHPELLDRVEHSQL